MKNFTQKYLDWYTSQDKLTRTLFCILWDIPSNLYRISKSALNDSIIGVLCAILLAVFGGWVLFVVDVLTIAFKDKVYWLEELGVDETQGIYKEDNDETSDETSDDDGIDGTVE